MDDSQEVLRDHRFEPPYISAEDRVVVVLGAGASISEMLALGAEKNVLPPTDANFLMRSKHCVPIKYAAMEKSFDAVWKGDEPRPLKHQRMEMLFSSAFLRVQQTSGTLKIGRDSRSLYDRLVELLRDTLSETTRKASPDQHLDLFKRINAQNPNSIDIISFNYDVLADRTLLQGAREELWDWNQANGYGFAPHNQPNARTKSSIRLLKLHGSMNWYIPTPGRTRASVYQKNANVYVPNPPSNPNAPAWQRQQYRLGHTDTKVFPLMVPPVFEKGSQIVGALQDVWDQAADALKHATVVFVWGYSLPQTDYHAEVLFAQSARRAKFRLIVCNPDRTALAHVTDICGHAWNRWYFRIEHFLREQST